MAVSPGSARGPISTSVAGVNRLAPVEAQLLCRVINEEIRAAAEGFDSAVEVNLLCECSKPGCWALLRISVADYEDVRRFPTRFLIRPNHLSEGTERIVVELSGFSVVEKVGSDAELAIQRDPRRPGYQPGHVPRPNQGPTPNGDAPAGVLSAQFGSARPRPTGRDRNHHPTPESRNGDTS